MFTNVINSAFGGVSTVKNSIGLLISMQELAKTDSMKFILSKKAMEIYNAARKSAIYLKRDFSFHESK